MSIVKNLNDVRRRVSEAAVRAGRRPESVRLVGVTKTVGTPEIRTALDAGLTDIGENYVQDSAVKFNELGRAPRWHMIGHLQKNKVKQAVRIFDVVQSVDSLRLAEEIGRRALDIGKVMEVMVEVDISGESTKSGTPPDEALSLCESVCCIEGVELIGLMGIAPFTSDMAAIKRSFALLRGLWESLPAGNRKWLSMGMTSDFEEAIEEGSNMVRIGSAIFGPRLK